MLNRALFSSVKDDWPTPWEFFHNLDLEFDFTLDVCAVPWSAKVWRYCVPPHALRVWGGKRRSAACSLTLLWTASHTRGSGSVAT